MLVQKMQVVSVAFNTLSQHYFFAMATFLDKLENKVQINHYHSKHFHTLKRLWKSVQYILRYSTKYASFLMCRTRSPQMSSVNSGVTQPKFTKFLHDIEVIIYAVNAPIEVAISHSILECQSNK